MKQSVLKHTVVVFVSLAVCLEGHVPLGFSSPQAPVSQGKSQPPQEDSSASSTPEIIGAAESYVDRFLSRVQNGVGFSIGVSESYLPELTVSTTGNQENATLTSLEPRVFIGATGTRSQFRLEYGFGYRRYNGGKSRFNSTSQTLGLSYDYQASPKIDIRLANHFSSAFNDYGLGTGSGLGVAGPVSFDQTLYTPRVRMTQEQIRGSVDYRATKRLNFTVGTSYYFWRYHGSPLGDTHALQLEVRTGYQLNKWLFLDNTYSQYLNHTSELVRPVNIQRLQIGGLTFRPRRGWDISFGGGIESANTQPRRQTSGSVQIGLAKNSRNTGFALLYHRGLSFAVGSAALMTGNNLTASLNRWFGRQVNVHLSSTYTRGAAIDSRRLDSVTGAADLQIALNSHLLLTGQYGYTSQRATNFAAVVPNVSRSTTTVGLQFFFSSVGLR